MLTPADSAAAKPDISVVIVNHNHRGIIEHCFDSLFRIPDRAMLDVILIDNTRTDGTSEWVHERYPGVRIHRNDVRRGFAANANAGMRELSGGRYVLLLNPDVVCFPGLLDRLLAFMDQNPWAGIAAPRLLNADGGLQHNCRRFPTPLALALRALRVGRIWSSARLRDYLMSDWDHAEAREIDWATGAVLLVRREAIETVGLMDTSFIGKTSTGVTACEASAGVSITCLKPAHVTVTDVKAPASPSAARVVSRCWARSSSFTSLDGIRGNGRTGRWLR